MFGHQSSTEEWMDEGYNGRMGFTWGKKASIVRARTNDGMTGPGERYVEGVRGGWTGGTSEIHMEEKHTYGWLPMVLGTTMG